MFNVQEFQNHFFIAVSANLRLQTGEIPGRYTATIAQNSLSSYIAECATFKIQTYPTEIFASE